MKTLTAVAAATLLTGCGGHSTSAGRAIFRSSCARCHTLTGHDTNATGGDLRVGRLSAADVASFVRVMPIEPPLDRADTRAVARYVASR
ncbi:MAG: c-type cytochrome [Gaiellaceae bacterium]